MPATQTPRPPATVTFQDPPNRRGSRRWALVSDELRAHPSEWAIVAENASASVATLIKQGGLTAFRPAGTFDATATKAEHGPGHTIYARFIAEADVA